MKMDVSKFKKVSTDKNRTVLMHPSGHKIVIAHKALNKENMDALGGLSEKKMMAKGGGAEEDTDYSTYSPDVAAPEFVDGQGSAPAPAPANVPPPSQDEKDLAYYKRYSASSPFYAQKAQELEAKLHPAPAPEAAPAEAPMAQDNAQAAPPAQSLAPQAAPQQAQPEQQAAPEAAPQAAQPAPEQAQQQQPMQQQPEYQKAYNDYKQAHLQNYAQEDAAFAHDLDNGHITPETYHSLFAKKDTLGKIGTIFGMMLSGAGSGLAHQQNALLASMNQEINNDLQAQMKSKENAQNYIKINQQQQFQNAQIKNMEKTGQLTDAQVKNMNAEAGLHSFALANMQANRAALHNQAMMVAKMPEGPQKMQAQQVLGMMGTAVTNENANIADVAASKVALMNSVGAGGGTMGLRLAGQDKLADAIDERTIPGVGMAHLPVKEDVRNKLQDMNVLEYKANDLLNFAKLHKGSLDPNVRAEAKQKLEEFKTYYSKSVDTGVQTEARSKWLDSQLSGNATSILQDILGGNSRIREIRDSSNQRRDIMLQGRGAPNAPRAPQSDTVVMTKNGQQYNVPRANVQKAIGRGYKAGQ